MKKRNVSKNRYSSYMSFLCLLIRCLILCYLCRLIRNKYSILRTCDVRNSRILSGPPKNVFFGSCNTNNIINDLEENLRDEWDIAVDNILRGDDTSTFHGNTSSSENSNYLSINVIHGIHRGDDTNIIEENYVASVAEIVESLHDSVEIDHTDNIDNINSMNNGQNEDVDYCDLSTCTTESSLSNNNSENYNASLNCSDDNVNAEISRDPSRNVERIQNTYNLFIVRPNTCQNSYPLMINVFNEYGEPCDGYPNIRNTVDEYEMEYIRHQSREDMNTLYEYTLIRLPSYNENKYMCSLDEDILYERNFLEDFELLKNKSYDMFIDIHFRLRKGIQCTDRLSIFSFDNNYGYGYYYNNNFSTDGEQNNSRDMHREQSSLNQDVQDSVSRGNGNYTSENKGRGRESTNICMNDRCPYDYYNIFDRGYSGNIENVLDHSEKEVDHSKSDINKDKDKKENKKNDNTEGEEESKEKNKEENKDNNKEENKDNNKEEYKDNIKEVCEDSTGDKKEGNEHELNNRSGNEMEVYNRTDTIFDNNEQNENEIMGTTSDMIPTELNVPSDRYDIDSLYLWSDMSSESTINYNDLPNLVHTQIQESSDTSVDMEIVPPYMPDLIITESPTNTSGTDTSIEIPPYYYRREQINDTIESPVTDYDDLYSSTDSYETSLLDVSSSSVECEESDVSATTSESDEGVVSLTTSESDEGVVSLTTSESVCIISATISDCEDTPITSYSESSEPPIHNRQQEESQYNNSVSKIDKDSNFRAYHVEIIINTDMDVNLLHHFIDYNGYKDTQRRKNLDSLLKALENLPKKDKSLNVWKYGLKVSLAIIEYVSNEIFALAEVIRDDFECNRGDCKNDGCKWCMAQSKFKIDILTLNFFMGSKRSNPNLSYKYLTCKEFILTRFKKLVYDSIDAIETYIAIVECFLSESIFDRIKDI
ncbi:Plasmodium exported protein, unknown function [Plasmodium reichenowi]|uniref:Uncharacterized protein n=1 Tax=Plasmodium reichenowi TaxID=5854 RepID=A0A2P9DRM6_PLARE|nr:Plasmodium exported protein, unknown function [Plasmodium reichenowi]